MEERGAADRLAGEFPHDLLEDILHGDEPEDLAVLVDDEPHVALVLLEVRELVEEGRSRGHEIRVARDFAQPLEVDLLAPRGVENLAHVQDADGVVEPALADDEPRVVRGRERRTHVLDVVLQVDVLDLPARRHRVVHRHVLELEEVEEDRAVLLRDELAAFEDEGAALIVD